MSYEARLICGFCKKETELSDELYLQIMKGEKQIYDLCDCGSISYNSSIRARHLVDTKGWRATYGSSK